MAAIYAQPAAANYFAPPPHAAKAARGYRLCDQCGAVETTSRFRVCGGCMTTNYCSSDCQRIHWPAHKGLCQHTTTTRASQGISEEFVAKCLRKFTSSHNSLLSWAGYQALRVKRHPSSIHQHAFLLELQLIDASADSRRRFAIQDTHLVPLSYITDAVVMDDIRRRDHRSRQTGGIGAMVIIIQCGSVSQVMPVEVDHPNKIGWDTRDDWRNVMSHFVNSGRTDFLPISTTSRGVVYG